MKCKQVVFIKFVSIAIVVSLAGGIATDKPVSASTRPNEIFTFYSEKIADPDIHTIYAGDWPMAGANPQRTSWTVEEVKGALKPLWFKPFEPYISQKVQVIAANDTLYISTARGLYALNTNTGAEKWVYPTELPLGHSPTIINDVAYVGGFDHKIHAINALTGAKLWTFEAGAGFHTNPLVVGGKLYAGNRDGYFYAIYTEGPNTGQLVWKYKTDGPVLFSAAYQDGVVFFASNDSYAYALNAETGALVWKSAKLPGAGFHSWWPVVYQDTVIFAGSNNYRTSVKPGIGKQFTEMELSDLYPNRKVDPRGTLVGRLGKEPGNWASGTATINMSRPNVTTNGSTKAVTEYFEEKPWRRTYFVLNRTTGQEITYDFDADGKRDYAPILWVGTHSGNRYPPVVGGDGVIYQSNNFKSDPWIAGGHISGWKINTPFISVPNSGWNAVDEPQAYAAGGNLIYWSRCCDRVGAAFDISQPGTEWTYFNYNLSTILPGYNVRYHLTGGAASFGGENGVYGIHGDTNPPIPYKGKVYMHRGNSIIALSTQTGGTSALPLAKTVTTDETNITPIGSNELRAQLEQEITKMLNAGHLRPGYFSHGIFDLKGVHECGDNLVDYWHNSSETIYTLAQALPHLSPDLQQQVRNYLKNEFNSYPPYQYNHIGWQSGASREIFDLPPEVETDLINYPPNSQNYTFNNSGGWQNSGVWGRNPYSFYALWKYAETFGNAQVIYHASKNTLISPPPDKVLVNMPYIHNAFIAGYIGYLNLEKLANQPESSNIKNELNRLLQLRGSNFTKNSAYRNITSGTGRYCRTLNIASNFMFLTPELAGYLHSNALNKVEEALNEYELLAPYWFVSFAEEGFGENAINPLYDSHSLFMAKALILQEPARELEKYLDVPAFARGDLFYIQKLVAILGSPAVMDVTPSFRSINSSEVATYTVQVQHTFTTPVTLMTYSSNSDLKIQLSSTTVVSPGGKSTLILTDLHDPAYSSSVWYTIPVIATSGEFFSQTVNVHLLVNGKKTYLPLIMK